MKKPTRSYTTTADLTGELIVSRGQLIEIGGSFRVPDVLAASGAELVEVGTTNRTRIADYAQAIGPRTAALLRVHQSNFRQEGFAEEVRLDELCRLGSENDLPVIDDLGSGALSPIADEPTLEGSVRAGATLVCCSADKLLGGPQAGIIAGTSAAVERCRKHPLARALRLDKMQLAALETTLRLWRLRGPTAIPALAMLRAKDDDLRERALRMVEQIGSRADLITAASRPGGGSLPGLELAGPVCAVESGQAGPDALLKALRAGEPPIIARIKADRVLLDPRTIHPDDIQRVSAAVTAALSTS